VLVGQGDSDDMVLHGNCDGGGGSTATATVTIMSESRPELLAWLNELLQINYTKIEQCRTGAAYCDPVVRRRGQSTETPATLTPIASVTLLAAYFTVVCIR